MDTEDAGGDPVSAIFGADMDPISALIGAGGSLLGGLMNSSALSSANANNMLMNTGAWKAQQIQQEAGALGVSPLAVLGGASSGGNIPFQAGNPGEVAASMGQNISRALAASQSGQQRLAKLQEQHLRLVNAGLAADVATKTAKASLDASSFGGSIPPAIPGYARFLDQYGNPFVSRTKELAESAFAGDPVQMVQGAAQSFEDFYRRQKDYFTTPPSVTFHMPDWLLRPDLTRIGGSGLNVP